MPRPSRARALGTPILGSTALGRGRPKHTVDVIGCRSPVRSGEFLHRSPHRWFQEFGGREHEARRTVASAHVERLGAAVLVTLGYVARVIERMRTVTLGDEVSRVFHDLVRSRRHDEDEEQGQRFEKLSHDWHTEFSR